MPGACAPSTSVSIPRSASARTICSIGSTRAVVLVTWSISASRVRGVTAPSIRSIAVLGRRTGEGERDDNDARARALGRGLAGRS